jgi:hypothetical protein
MSLRIIFLKYSKEKYRLQPPGKVSINMTCLVQNLTADYGWRVANLARVSKSLTEL